MNISIINSYSNRLGSQAGQRKTSTDILADKSHKSAKTNDFINYIPTFGGGLKNNLKTAKSCLNSFNSEFKYLQSNSKIPLLINRHFDDPKFAQVLEKIKLLQPKYNSNVGLLRTELQGVYRSFEDYIQRISFLMQKHKSANCHECSNIIQFKLLQNNIEAHNVSIDVYNIETHLPKMGGNHQFTVFGLKKGADIESPKTWGSEAVVVDAWQNISLPAAEAIDLYKKNAGFDPAKHVIFFSGADLVDVDLYMQGKRNFKIISI